MPLHRNTEYAPSPHISQQYAKSKICIPRSDSPWAHLTLFFICGPLPPLLGPSRAVSSPGCASAFGHGGRRHGSARARPRGRNLRRVSPQSTGLLTERVATRMIFCLDSFGGVLSDLRSFGSVGAAVLRTCAGGRKVEIYMTCFTRPARTCHPLVSMR